MRGIKRRRFLKIAGLSAALGLGGKAAFELINPGRLDAAEEMPNATAFKGKHWGMAIDLEKFKSEADIKPIVDACHLSHNVPFIPTNQDIKWIWSVGYDHAFTHKTHALMADSEMKDKPVLVLCNHCENPPCVRVCPTQATFQREDGIVLMDFHRCIGCRFCMGACPYGSRSFNFGDPKEYLEDGKPTNPDFPTRTKGVVEKCNFCAERLAVGKIPACVEAAAPGQLIFGDLADPRSEIRKALRTRYSIRRKPYLGTRPSVYYLV